MVDGKIILIVITSFMQIFILYGNFQNVSPKKRPLWFIFSGMGSQWQGMGSQLMNLPIFSDVIDRCDCILKPRGVDIKDILTSLNPKLFDNILNSFVGIAAVQVWSKTSIKS